MATLFGRQLRLLVFDVTGGYVDLGRLSCRFEVSRLSSTGLNRAKLAIYNLSHETIERISQEYLGVSIEAGYASRYKSIFQGQIKYVFPTQEGPDRITEIFASDGARDYEHARVVQTFSAGTSLHDIIRVIAASFQEVALTDLSGLTDVVVSGATVESDHARNVLDRLAETYAFNWSIQNGALQILDDGRSLGGPPIVVSRDTGMIGTPLSSNIGVQVRTLLNPSIVPGARVNIITAGATPQVSDEVLVGGGVKLLGLEGGEFNVLRVVHTGETRRQAWYTEAFVTTGAVLP